MSSLASVALLAEGVDRNILELSCFHSLVVALLAEGVDRNFPPSLPPPEKQKSPSSRRAWIEIRWRSGCCRFCGGSPSSRRAWIEITAAGASGAGERVALLAEGVDRNRVTRRLPRYPAPVALLAEGVDRNTSVRVYPLSAVVALLAEGVDRNRCHVLLTQGVLQVALLAEGVDRNFPPSLPPPEKQKSPSSRRAWIEIRRCRAG